MATYISREKAIVAKAEKCGISAKELTAVFERKLQKIPKEYKGGDVGERLRRAEGEVWGIFCESWSLGMGDGGIVVWV